ncbi:MAG: MFS transporter, partial [Planctomycetes bacterium]|nr:MFS transporter [Planctomycetota bacterium]
MALSRRLLAVSLLFNLANYLAWSVIPARAAFGLGATAGELGALPVLGGVTYILMSLRMGAISDRYPRQALARIGIAGWVAFSLLAWRADSMVLLYAASVLDGASQAFVWPALQAHVGDVSRGRNLERNLGTFSISWSLGKTVGFLLFGGIAFLLARSLEDGAAAGTGTSSPEAAYFPWILLGCGALAFAVLFLFPPPGPGRAPEEAAEEEEDHVAEERARFRMAGWIANFAGFGLGATLVYHYAGALKGWGRPAWEGGAVVGTVYLAQTASFHLLGRWTAWHWRGGPLLGAAALGAAALLGILLGAPLAAALPAAAVLGLAMGLCYMASI